MKLCLLFLVLTPVFCSRAAKPTGQEPALVSVPCNDPVAGSIAYLSLRQLNANRKEGSVFTLHRISNVQEHFNEETGSVYYLVLDVLETDCHVLSLRLLDDCKPTPFNKALFGQCKVTFQLNKPRRIAHLHNYDCTLQPVSRIPDPSPEYDVEAQEIAKQSLEKFNKDSDYSKYFVLGNITRATKKDDAYFVEFTILESSCNKTNPQGEQCEPLDCEFAHSGYCSVVFPADNLTVHCDVFEPEAAILEEQRHQDGHAQDKPDQSDQRPHQGNRGERGKKHEHSHHKHGHKHSKKHEHKHGHKHDHKHHHKHDHKHDDHDDSESHEHEHEHLHQYEHHHTPTKGGHGPPEDPRKTVGIIRILNPGLQPSDAPKEKGNKGKKHSGDTKTVPSGRPGSRPFILPFPEKASTSDQCPGQPEKVVNTDEAPNQPTSIPK